MRKIYVRDGAQFVWQWQPKEHIVLDGYPDGVFVRYANCDTVEAPVVQTRREGGKLIADIPPELMMTDKDITIYVCDEGGIIHCHFISVVSTPKPESYIYEPVEILRYDTLAERIRLIEEWIAAGGSGPGGGDIPASPSFDDVNIGGAEGFYITSSGEPEKPRAEFFGANGDEQVELGNIARATHLNSAVPLGQANEMLDAVAETIPRSAADIGADPAGTAAAAVSVHNGQNDSHPDIRVQVAGKLDSSALPQAIDAALAEAKKSGAFDGADGADGRGIKSIARTSGNGAAGTTDTYTITYTDGTKSTYQVRNGADGGKGDPYELTDDDKAEITAAVIEGLPKYAGEVS